jgi:hypothetical protein
MKFFPAPPAPPIDAATGGAEFARAVRVGGDGDLTPAMAHER